MKNKSVFYHIRQLIIDPQTNRAISQEKYGKFLGYDKSTICLNEKKGHKPSINFIYAVSKATGVPIDYIAEKLIGPYLPEPELMKYLDHEKLKKFTKKST